MLCTRSKDEKEFTMKIGSIAVILLYIVSPILAYGSNTTAAVNSIETQNFNISGNWDKRLDSGGGSMDGGGGNTGANGQLLDESTQSGSALSNKKLLQNLLSVLGERLNGLEKALPGFQTWITSALKSSIVWALDEKEFNQEICRNYKFHEGTQDLVACQSMTRVHFQKYWYDSTVSDTLGGSEKLAKMTLHELVRFHVIRLAKEKKLQRDQQDEITAAVTRLILNNTISGSMLYNELVKFNLLLVPIRLQTARLHEIAEITQIIAKNITLLSSLYELCNKADNKKEIQDLGIQVGRIILRAVSACEANLGEKSSQPVGKCVAFTADDLSKKWIDKCDWIL
jgi:hypothetical protein